MGPTAIIAAVKERTGEVLSVSSVAKWEKGPRAGVASTGERRFRKPQAITKRVAPLAALLEHLPEQPEATERHRFLAAFAATFEYLYPAPCVHDWKLDEPKGPLSGGVCQKCGITGEFATSERGWGRNGAKA